MSGGVRNLRAMFENKDSTSPPERGRSPGESLGASSTGTSPRPLSKVRTSFVTVEKSGQFGGQLGLKRADSGSTEPKMTKRRTSFSMDEKDHPKETAERKESLAAEFEARTKNSLIREVVPEVAVETPALEVERKLKLPRSPRVKKEVKSEPSKTDVKKVNSAANGAMNGSAKPAERSASNSPSKPAPITTARTSTAAKAPPSPSKVKSPALKTPTTPRSTLSKVTPEAKIEKKVEKKEEPKKINRNSVQPSQTTKPASKPPTTAAHAPKTKIPASPPQTGFHKPRPKSPTRPVKLPASLTTHTASSGAKTSTGTTPPKSSRQSLSRASGNTQPSTTFSRSPSRTIATAAKGAVARTASVLRNGSSRPSLGPPPAAAKKHANRQSLPPADDSFLARMMRPTTASASKVHEDKPPEPQRSVSVKRPTTRDGPKHHEPAKPASVAHKKEPTSAPAKTIANTKPAVKKEPKVTSPAKPTVKAEPKIASPAKPQPKVASPAKKEEPKPEVAPPVEVKKEEEPAVETAQVAEAKEVEAIAPKVEEALKVEEAPEVEEIKASEPIASGTERKEEEPVVEAAPPAESSKTPSKSEKPEPLASPEKVLSTIEESPAPVAAKESVVPPIEEAKSATALPIRTKTDATSTPTITSPIKSPIKSPTVEDPEDVKAREEIARLNAELMKGAEVD